MNDEEEHESEQEVSLDDSQLDSSQLSVVRGGRREAILAPYGRGSSVAAF